MKTHHIAKALIIATSCGTLTAGLVAINVAGRFADRAAVLVLLFSGCCAIVTGASLVYFAIRDL